MTERGWRGHGREVMLGMVGGRVVADRFHLFGTSSAHLSTPKRLSYPSPRGFHTAPSMAPSMYSASPSQYSSSAIVRCLSLSQQACEIESMLLRATLGRRNTRSEWGVSVGPPGMSNSRRVTRRGRVRGVQRSPRAPLDFTLSIASHRIRIHPRPKGYQREPRLMI